MTEFETVGYREIFDDPVTGRVLGWRRVDRPTRPCGSPGRELVEVREDLKILKGIDRPVSIKASPKKPKRLYSTIERICGRRLE
mgnify:CR=1 FL=1